MTLTFMPTEAMILATYAAFNKSLQSVQNLTGVTWAMNIEALPPQYYARGVADNALGLAGHTKSLGLCLLSPS